VLRRHPVRVLVALSGVVLVTYVAYRLISESGLSIRKSLKMARTEMGSVAEIIATKSNAISTGKPVVHCTR
jgi:hypothetical protein